MEELLNISFNKGVRRAPTYAENGELSEAVGIIPSRGELKNIPPMSRLKDGEGEDFVFPDTGHTLVGVHQIEGDKVYVSKKRPINAYKADWFSGSLVLTFNYILDATTTITVTFTDTDTQEPIERSFELSAGGTSRTFILQIPELSGDVEELTIVVSSPGSLYIFELYDGDDFDSLPNHKWELYASRTAEREATTHTRIGGGLADGIKMITVGRIMIVTDETGLHYYIYKGGQYKYLGREIPRLPINFSLKGEIITGTVWEWDGKSDTSQINTDPSGFLHEADSRNHLKNITNLLYAAAAKQTQKAAKDGCFMHPFFVRYALRMYDGTHTQVSAPVLMMVSSNQMFIMASGWHTTSTHINYCMIKAQLEYYIAEGIKEQFEDWSDLIKGVDIFVSAPIYSYHADGSRLSAHHIFNYLNFNAGYITSSVKPYFGFTVADMYGINASHSGFLNKGYCKWDMPLLYAISMLKNSGNHSCMTNWNAVLSLEERDVGTLREDYKGETVYYLLRSMDFSELVENTRTRVMASGEGINNIATAQKLIETESLTNIKGMSDIMIYNRRLNISDVKQEVKCMTDLSTLLPHTDGYIEWTVDADGFPVISADSEGAEAYNLSLDIDNEQGGTPFRVNDEHLSSGATINLKSSLLYLAYPNINASKAVIYRDDNGTKRGVTLSLKSGLLFNAAYYSAMATPQQTPPSEAAITDSLTPTQNNIVYHPNRLLQSEVENPFVFTGRGVHAIGNGRILKLATNAEPLSTGQYGQYPLIAFCSDGMYALEVNADGMFGAASPLSHHILTNIDSIAYVEGGLLFITKGGLQMLGQDKKITLLSSNLEGENINEAVYVGDDTPAGQAVTEWSSLFMADTEEIREALQTCKTVYDSKNSLLHVFFSDSTKQMVLCLKAFEWSSQIDNGRTIPLQVVEDFPTSVMQFTDDMEHLYVYDSVPSNERRRGFAISRILDMGGAGTYSVIKQMKLYHNISRVQTHNIRTALYASNDMFSWTLVRSLRGASYKYYRFALFTNMTDYEAVQGMSIIYEPRRGNKLR